jgi:hypothetical protein
LRYWYRFEWDIVKILEYDIIIDVQLMVCGVFVPDVYDAGRKGVVVFKLKAHDAWEILLLNLQKSVYFLCLVIVFKILLIGQLPEPCFMSIAIWQLIQLWCFSILYGTEKTTYFVYILLLL